MKILQIVSGRGVNGALVYCKILSEELVRRGHQVTIVCRPDCWLSSQVDHDLVTVVESSLSRFPLSELQRVTAIVRQQRFDLMHSHMTRAQNFGIGLKWLTGVPIIATAHNCHFELHWNFNDYIIANSQSTYEYHAAVNRISSRKMEAIYCCTDLKKHQPVLAEATSRLRQRLKFNPDDFVIGIVGEVAIRKGHEYFLRALPEIIRSVPRLKVLFVGRFGRKQPHVRKMRAFILQHHLEGRTKWVGRQFNVAEYLTACQITVVPSLEEPLGLVAIESLLAGVPVVASNTGGLPEIVEHRHSGLLVPPKDVRGLAQAVIHLAGDATLRESMGEYGRQAVTSKFSPAQLIDQVEQVYQRVLANKLVA